MRLFWTAFAAIVLMSSSASAQSDPCSDPNNAVWHDGPYMANLWSGICQKKLQEQRQAEEAQQQQREVSQERQQQAAQAADEQRRAEEKAAGRGYVLVSSIKDLMLDGRELANRNAKIQIVGIYRKIGDVELLYGSQLDAYQSDDSFVPVLTDDAQRDLREYLLNYSCKSEVGCRIDVGGHMMMCRNLSALYQNYPARPCLNIEVEIVYRPGD
jgi:hypothetical protein